MLDVIYQDEELTIFEDEDGEIVSQFSKLGYERLFSEREEAIRLLRKVIGFENQFGLHSVHPDTLN